MKLITMKTVTGQHTSQMIENALASGILLITIITQPIHLLV